MSVIERARTSGKCPPSLLKSENGDDSFEAGVAKVMDVNGTFFVRSFIASLVFVPMF